MRSRSASVPLRLGEIPATAGGPGPRPGRGLQPRDDTSRISSHVPDAGPRPHRPAVAAARHRRGGLPRVRTLARVRTFACPGRGDARATVAGGNSRARGAPVPRSREGPSARARTIADGRRRIVDGWDPDAGNGQRQSAQPTSAKPAPQARARLLEHASAQVPPAPARNRRDAPPRSSRHAPARDRSNAPAPNCRPPLARDCLNAVARSCSHAPAPTDPNGPAPERSHELGRRTPAPTARSGGTRGLSPVVVLPLSPNNQRRNAAPAPVGADRMDQVRPRGRPQLGQVIA